MNLTEAAKILNIEPNATKEQVHTAYKKMTKLYHPDLHPNDENAKDMMQSVNAANMVFQKHFLEQNKNVQKPAEPVKDETKFANPVYIGDELTVRGEIVELIESVKRLELKVMEEIDAISDSDPFAVPFEEIFEPSVRVFNCLKRSHIDTIYEIIEAFKTGDILKVRNLGHKSIAEIIESLGKFGVNFTSKDDGTWDVTW